MALPSYAFQTLSKPLTSRTFDLQRHGIAGTRLLDQQRLSNPALVDENGVPRNRAMRTLIERVSLGNNPSGFGSRMTAAMARAYGQSGEMPIQAPAPQEASALRPENQIQMPQYYAQQPFQGQQMMPYPQQQPAQQQEQMQEWQRLAYMPMSQNYQTQQYYNPQPFNYSGYGNQMAW